MGILLKKCICPQIFQSSQTLPFLTVVKIQASVQWLLDTPEDTYLPSYLTSFSHICPEGQGQEMLGRYSLVLFEVKRNGEWT